MLDEDLTSSILIKSLGSALKEMQSQLLLTRDVAERLYCCGISTMRACLEEEPTWTRPKVASLTLDTMGQIAAYRGHRTNWTIWAVAPYLIMRYQIRGENGAPAPSLQPMKLPLPRTMMVHYTGGYAPAMTSNLGKGAPLPDPVAGAFYGHAPPPPRLSPNTNGYQMPRQPNLLFQSRRSQGSASNVPGPHYDAERDDGPVGFRPVELPVPCAYIKLPWPSHRKLARLLPPPKDKGNAAGLFRCYVKRMVLEELCQEPPSFLVRYCHYAQDNGPGADLFEKCRANVPALQMMSLQHQLARFDGTSGDTLGSTSINVMNQLPASSESPNPCNERIFTIHHLVANWATLPLCYRDIERLWVARIVPTVHKYFSELEDVYEQPDCNLPPQVNHLAIVLDCSVHNAQWESHCMRLIVHLIAQLIAVASSTLPLYCQREPTRRGALIEGFRSCQIIILPPSAFNDAVSHIRARQVATRASERMGGTCLAGSIAGTTSIAVDNRRYVTSQHTTADPNSTTSVVSMAKGGKIVMGTANKRKLFCWPNDSSSKSVDNVQPCAAIKYQNQGVRPLRESWLSCCMPPMISSPTTDLDFSTERHTISKIFDEGEINCRSQSSVSSITESGYNNILAIQNTPDPIWRHLKLSSIPELTRDAPNNRSQTQFDNEPQTCRHQGRTHQESNTFKVDRQTMKKFLPDFVQIRPDLRQAPKCARSKTDEPAIAVSVSGNRRSTLGVGESQLNPLAACWTEIPEPKRITSRQTIGGVVKQQAGTGFRRLTDALSRPD